MKHLKTFEKEYRVSNSDDEYSSVESNEERKYWILPTDNRFIKGLQQINCPEVVQKELNTERIYLLNPAFHHYNKFIIVFFLPEEDFHPWLLASYYDNIEYFNNAKSFKFGGFINIEEYELDADKYNL